MKVTYLNEKNTTTTGAGRVGRPAQDFKFPKGSFSALDLAKKKKVSIPYSYAKIREYQDSLKVVSLVKPDRHTKGRATKVYRFINRHTSKAGKMEKATV